VPVPQRLQQSALVPACNSATDAVINRQIGSTSSFSSSFLDEIHFYIYCQQQQTQHSMIINQEMITSLKELKRQLVRYVSTSSSSDAVSLFDDAASRNRATNVPGYA